jgi:S1-C subfamily serine protease
MSPAQVEQAQSLARAWRPKRSSQPATQSPVVSGDDSALSRPDITGSGFVLSAHDVLTNYHVIESCSTIRFVGPAGTQLLRVAATDAHNDLAVLRSESIFASTATLSDGRAAKLGESVVAVGFPLRGLLTSSMTVTTGTVSATAGPGDDSRFLQVTAPVQPGSSGGPVLDLSGRVIGVVVSKLDFRTTLKTAGEIPENVNFAIKVALVREFLDAHDISYRSTPPSATSAVTDIAAQARQFTIAIECWK